MGELKDFITQAARTVPDKPAIIFDDQKISYHSLEYLIDQCADGLLRFGLDTRQEVLVMMDNSVELVVTLLALFKINARAFLLPLTLKPDELARATGHVVIDSCVVSTKSLPVALEGIKQLSPNVIGCTYNNGELNFEPLFGVVNASNRLGVNGTILRMISSGSTGVPKQMLRTAESVIHMCDAAKDFFKLNEHDVLVNFVPPYHIMGVAQIILAFYLQATLLLEKNFIPGKILSDIEKYQATWMMASPFLLNILTMSASSQINNLSSMRNAISSSSPLPRNIYENFRSRFGIPLHEVYGSTEATVVTAEIDDGVFQPNVVGRPVKWTNIKIVDDNFIELPIGEVGHVATSSPMVVAGYENNPLATKTSFVDKYVLVGDRGFIDEMGQLHIVGRTNDIINVAGKKVDPVEVEQVLVDYPGVKEAAVYGVDAPDTQVVKAAIVATTGVDENELKKYCQTKLSGYKVPKSIRFVDALPRNQTGKLMRHQLRDE